jgi:hypothetical protein
VDDAGAVLDEIDLRDLLHHPGPPLSFRLMVRLMARVRRSPSEDWFNSVLLHRRR